MNHIIDNIFIGNLYDARNYELLKKNNITHILVVGEELDGNFPNLFQYLRIPIPDYPNIDITRYFHVVKSFLDESKKSGFVLVHCAMGISRSVSMVISYLINTYRLSYIEALSLVRSKRNIANPNEGFKKQLIEYSYNVLGKM